MLSAGGTTYRATRRMQRRQPSSTFPILAVKLMP
jgi:hypothetical protein